MNLQIALTTEDDGSVTTSGDFACGAGTATWSFKFAGLSEAVEAVLEQLPTQQWIEQLKSYSAKRAA